MNELQKARLRMGLTLDQAAKRIGITRQHYTFVERGERTPSLAVATRLAESFGISLDSIRDISVTAKAVRAAVDEVFSDVEVAAGGCD